MKTLIERGFFLLFLGVSFFGGEHTTWAQTPQKTLIAIGYIDDHGHWTERMGLGSYDYHPALAASLRFRLHKEILDQGFQFLGLEMDSHGTSFLYRRENQELQLLDPNGECESDRLVEGRRQRAYFYKGCPEQKNRSHFVAQQVRDQFLHVDHFIYLGHARYGSGLSFGHTNDTQAKVKPQETPIYGTTEFQIQKVLIAACESEALYRSDFEELFSYSTAPYPEFQGFPDSPLYVGQDPSGSSALSRTLTYLRQIL